MVVLVAVVNVVSSVGVTKSLLSNDEVEDDNATLLLLLLVAVVGVNNDDSDDDDVYLYQLHDHEDSCIPHTKPIMYMIRPTRLLLMTPIFFSMGPISLCCAN